MKILGMGCSTREWDLWEGYPGCRFNGRILLVNLLLCDTTAVSAADCPCSYAFNDGICEAHFSALRD
jgi:hypothetical protein